VSKDRLPLVPPRPELESMGRAFHAARATQRIAACLAVTIDGWERLADVLMREQSREGLDALVRARVQPDPPLVFHVGERVWVLVTATDVREAEGYARELVHAGRRRRIRISVGLGLSLPGVRFEVWLRVAEEGLAVARNAGGDRAVHTEVYELVERQLAGASFGISGTAAEVPAPNAAQDTASARGAPATLDSSKPKQPAPSRVDPTAASPKRIDADEPPVLHGVLASRLELLERRIERLSRAMDSIDARLARVEGRGRASEEGIASIYREVQGLELDAPNVSLKRQLMAAIFEANLALRARNAG
jgi:hypothetical protein